MRLNRFLATAGLGSRRACEELIRAGRIVVNGETAVFPGPEVEPGKDRVTCDGETLRFPRRWIYLAMHKPAGYVTTHGDPQHRQTVDDLLGRWRGKVFAVGRLDRDSEGLLLFTNNGELSNRLLHPRYRQERTYLVWVRPHPTRRSSGGSKPGSASVRENGAVRAGCVFWGRRETRRGLESPCVKGSTGRSAASSPP